MAVITIPGIEQAIADLNKPAIPEGKYLAVIQNVEVRVNERGSMGFMWSLLVNTSDFAEGWDSEGRTYPLKHYTYLGKVAGNGKLSDTSGNFKAIEFLMALGNTSGVVDTDDAQFRQVIVQIKHKPDDRDVAANLDNPRLWPRAEQILKYERDGEVAPKLKALSDMAEAGQSNKGNDTEF